MFTSLHVLIAAFSQATFLYRNDATVSYWTTAFCRFNNKQTIANADINVDLNINTTERKWAEVDKARPSSHVMNPKRFIT